MPTNEWVDEMITGNILDGMMEVAGVNDDGELTFRLSDEGVRRARRLLTNMGIDPDRIGEMSPAEFRKAIGL